MAVVLSLLSALAYGVSDFLGGLLSKASGPWRVTAIGQATSTLCVTAAALFVAGSPLSSDFGWGALGGVGSGLGAAFLYRGLASAKMSVVAPISAVGTALLPVAVGVGLGERPSSLTAVGIALAFPAIALISIVRDPGPSHRGGVLDGVLAGIGFGILFISLGQVGDDSGLWPLAVMYLASTIAVVGVAAALRESVLPRSRADWRALVLGPIGVVAVLAFHEATQHGLLTVVSVIAALYPASTVLLAAVVLHERVTRWQGLGLALAVGAVSLVALG